MTEYIEREATCGDCIHAKVCEHMPTLTGFDRNNTAYCKAFVKAADAVEVVRCKDCKHCMPTYDGRSFYCSAMTNRNFVHENHYCSYGERRADDD